MIIGQIYRTARPYGPDPEVIDGYPNYFYETHCKDMPLLNLERGIFTPARTVAESGIRRAVVILSRAIASAGTERNPWTGDNFDVEKGVIYYSGDNKVAGADPDTAHGNRELIAQYNMTRSDDITVRQNAAPIVCFERVAVNGHEKGYLKFKGYGFVNNFELVEERHATGASFENYRFEIALLPVHRDNFFDWNWINKRRSAQYNDVDTLKFAPASWQNMVRNGFEVLGLKRSDSTISSVAEVSDNGSLPKTISASAAAAYVGEGRAEVLKRILDWVREDHSQKKHISQSGNNWFVNREWFLTQWQRKVFSCNNAQKKSDFMSDDPWISSVVMSDYLDVHVSKLEYLLSQATDNRIISSAEARFTTFGWMVREQWGKSWLKTRLSDIGKNVICREGVGENEPATNRIATELSEEITGKLESLDVFEHELNIPTHAMELLLNAELSKGNIDESNAIYMNSGWGVSRDWFIPWILSRTGKASVPPEVSETPDVTEIEGEMESRHHEFISSSDQSFVRSLLDDLESKLDQLLAPDPLDEEEKPYQFDNGNAEECMDEGAPPKVVELFKKHFEIQSSIRSDLELIYGNIVQATSLLEENIDKDKSAAESFLGRVLLRSVEEVKQEHEFIRRQLMKVQNQNDVTKVVNTLIEGVGNVDATLNRLEALVMQSLLAQKASVDLLSDSVVKLQGLNGTLLEKASIEQTDTKELLIKFEKFINTVPQKRQ